PVVDEKSLEAGLPQPGAAQVEVAPVAGFVPGDMISRIAAFFIDSIVVWALAWPLRAFSSAVFGTFASGIFEFTANALSFLSWYVVVFAYYGWFYSKKGASPGKLLMGLQVIDSTDGGHLTYWRAFFREAIGKWISMVPLGIGYFTAFFRSDRRALHDLLFDTAVVKGPSAKNKT
ncbi:MAG TPA: RDD family protein, partial [Bdellovibrionales bacterium]|nr:RDD family protein [Bdellovibrionales bacterium]